ncbi:transporter associated domain protein [Clostridium argentinense CDC 2741]|uniref:Transporter associated domain protein n=1 Tax=Clostridium argentinense CDC 2741 TaxID=1418104 RepID=A0A0C1R6S3_9CLOT|nr:hemolysin family protein [Clostridium argentinense]ARC85904.1 hemolysin [Clostridium argentinense]KIE46196.1 transporter associated domain protein [Clostridium argentinense CDC 2741]NFF38832.1 HlyC/CorC family transporter [Clostridium argentinense]NFP48624.1 HlyC/CorC family transporter [Clostridium argentinense]NFP71108.1 HlyC/CorC family transporter [Clostridium argentinense]
MEGGFGSSNIIFQIILVVILTLINAFFSSAEMAIISMNKNRIKILAEEGNKKAQLLEKLNEEPSKLLATIQVGITLAGFFSSASAATGISSYLSRYLSQFNIPYVNQISLISITIIIAYLTLVFGELYPKRIALQKSEAIAMLSIKPILIVSKITGPFVKLLSLSTNALVKLSGLNTENLDEKISREEIKSLVHVGREHGVFNETESEMINSIIEFDDKLAKEVMKPRTETFLLNINTPIMEALDKLLEENYSRVPVYEENPDNIIGILYMRDMLAEAKIKGFENIEIRQILHKPYFVIENKPIDDLFKELQSKKIHMAVLIDEYGGFSGIVTIEDLIEEVMGEINDEYDELELLIEKIDDNTFLINGLISLNDFNSYFDVDLECEDFDTIGGFLLNIIGGIPETDEEKLVEYENLSFKVEEILDKRIGKIKMYIER